MQATTKGRIGAVALGAISASIGMLPWWITGAQLPLQNLWGTSTTEMPLALVPFSQYYVHSVAAMFIVGAGIAGLIAGFIPGLRARRWWVVLGVSGLQAIAVVQSAFVTLLGLRGDSESQLYFTVIVALLALGLAVAFATTALCSVGRGSATHAGASDRWLSPPWLLGATLFVLFLDGWVREWLGALAPNADHSFVVLSVLPWIAPVGVGVAIVFVGVHTAGRISAVVGGLLLLWVVPAAMTGMMVVLGSRVMLNNLSEAREYALAAFQQYLFTPELALRPLVIAAVTALIGLALRYLVAGRSLR